jgi:holin-like protein
MKGIAVLFGFQSLGMVLHGAGVPLPGTILGLLLFTLALAAGLVRLAWVEDTSRFLLDHMLLFFTPVIVTAGTRLAGMKGHVTAILASVVVSLLAVLLTTGLVGQRLLGPAREPSHD